MRRCWRGHTVCLSHSCNHQGWCFQHNSAFQLGKKSPCWPLPRDSSNLVPTLIHHNQNPEVQYIRGGDILRTSQWLKLAPSVWVKKDKIPVLDNDQSWALRSMGHAPGTGEVEEAWQEGQSVRYSSSPPFLSFLIQTWDGWVCRGTSGSEASDFEYVLTPPPYGWHEFMHVPLFCF